MRTTDYERTEQSLKAYMAGIFSQRPENFEIPDPVDPDPFLRVAKNMDKILIAKYFNDIYINSFQTFVTSM